MITEKTIETLKSKSKEELLDIVIRLIEEEEKQHYHYETLVNSGLHGAELSNLD